MYSPNNIQRTHGSICPEVSYRPNLMAKQENIQLKAKVIAAGGVYFPSDNTHEGTYITPLYCRYLRLIEPVPWSDPPSPYVAMCEQVEEISPVPNENEMHQLQLAIFKKRNIADLFYGEDCHKVITAAALDGAEKSLLGDMAP